MTDQSKEQETIFSKPTEDQTVTTQGSTDNQQSQVVKESQTIDIDAIFNDQLSSIVDDNGERKYKDVMTALEALKYTQRHVKTLEEENRTFREKQMESQTLDQALQNISAKKEVQAPTSQETKIDAEQLKGITLETLMEYENSKQQSANKQSVQDALVGHFGDVEKAKAAYIEKAQELGVDIDTMSSLAAKSPKAALAYFNITEKSNKPLTSKEGSINTEAFAGQNKQQPTDYLSRYFKPSSENTSKWRSAGEALNLKD